MRATTCEEIEDLIERESLGWSEADRLRVEQHLGACEACRETLAISRFVRDTLRDAAGELTEAARSRAIHGALSRGRPGKSLRPGPRRVLGVSAVLLSVAAAAGLVLYLAQPRTQLAKPESHPTAQPKLASAPIRATSSDQPATVPAAPGAEQGWIETTTPEQHRFAHAKVTLAAQTRARFDATEHTLELGHGRVEVDVDAARGLPFIVVTEHLRVEVLGTHFSVTPDSVSVKHGRVQVFARDGRVLARELAAGGSYHYGATSQSLEHATPGALGIPRGSEPRPASAALQPGAGTDEAKPSEAKPSEVATKSAATWLQEARAALARGDSPTARALVDSAEASRPTRGERAEASTLRAEAALLERDQASALRLYREIGERYADLSAGDNAAFAAAQLAARADKAHERELLESYLSRFPSGRFRDEAKQRLARLAR